MLFRCMVFVQQELSALLGWNSATDPAIEQFHVVAFRISWMLSWFRLLCTEPIDQRCVCVCVYLLCEEQEKKIQLVNKNLLFLIPPLQPRSPPEWMLFHCNGGHIVRLMGCKADIKPALLCPQGAAGVSVHQIFPSNLFLPSSLHGTYAHPCCWWGKRA